MLKFFFEQNFFLQNLYSISGIIITITALFGLLQIRLFKKNLELTGKIATYQKALEYSDRFLTSNRLLMNRFINKCKDNDIPYNYSKCFDESNVLDFKNIPDSFKVAHNKRMELKDEWIPLLNDLQVIASAFVSGVADEEIGFACIGRTFCDDFISIGDIVYKTYIYKPDNYYSNIEKLYDTWKYRVASNINIYEEEQASQTKQEKAEENKKIKERLREKSSKIKPLR